MLYDNYSENFEKPTKPPKSSRPKSAGISGTRSSRERESMESNNGIKSPKKRSGSPQGSERYSYMITLVSYHLIW